MQQFQPPFVPRVESWEDTKYFDDEGPISDLDSATSEDGSHPLSLENNPPNPSCHQQEAQGIVPETPAGELLDNILTLAKGKGRKRKDKKRPRDKVLRDPTCGKMALRMRKDSAFAGYGYHAAKSVSEVIDDVLAEEGVLRECDLIAGANLRCS